MTQTLATNGQEVLLAIQGWKYWDEIQLGAEKEYGMTRAEFERLLPEYCKFMGLVALGHTGLAMFSDQVDKIWHAHKEGEFALSSNLTSAAERFRNVYISAYGELPNDIWNLHRTK